MGAGELADAWVHGWHWHPEQLAGIALLGLAYLLGTGPLRGRVAPAERVERHQPAFFGAGILVLFVAVASPLHEISEWTFGLHMVQHMLLVLGVPPLLLLGTPGWLLRPLPRYRPVLPAARRLTHPAFAFLAWNVVFNIWHFPLLFEGALARSPVHGAEHVTMLAASLLLWWPLLSPVPELPRSSYPGQMIYAALTAITTTPLFGILVFADAPVYDWYAYAPGLDRMGLSPVLDQQVGGFVMKLPMAAVFLGMMAVAFGRWFAAQEASARAPEPDLSPGHRDGAGEG